MNKFLKIFDLHQGEEKRESVMEDVVANISFKGATIWILACAIVVASIGLNVNSTAVIIGAMLISPLMGPIVGAGFALGTYDFDLLKKSLKNLFVATGVSLLVAFLYFLLSPFKETQSELLARTHPNIYDVLIAFFGGLVGVIAITRVEKGNPIPGVAIATALMPPLCTAGYGLAVGNLNFFLGAIYLYSINCFFICIATFSIVKYLQYPVVRHVDPVHQKRVKYGISTLILLMILPSFYLAYKLYFEKKFSQHVEHFISEEMTGKGYTLIFKRTNYGSTPKTLEVAFLEKLNEQDVRQLNDKMKYYKVEDTKLIVRQDTSDLKNDILNEIGRTNLAINEKDAIIKRLEQEIDKNKFDNQQILSECKVLFPSVERLSLANHYFNENTDSSKVMGVMVYECREPLDSTSEVRLRNWLKTKLKMKYLELHRLGH